MLEDLENSKKTQQIMIRATKEMKKLAENKAKQLGLSLSSYVLMLISKDNEKNKKEKLKCQK